MALKIKGDIRESRGPVAAQTKKVFDFGYDLYYLNR
jgi:hypothetical protein